MVKQKQLPTLWPEGLWGACKSQSWCRRHLNFVLTASHTIHLLGASLPFAQQWAHVEKHSASENVRSENMCKTQSSSNYSNHAVVWCKTIVTNKTVTLCPWQSGCTVMSPRTLHTPCALCCSLSTWPKVCYSTYACLKWKILCIERCNSC